MPQSALYGNWGRYKATPPVLADKAAVALQVSLNGTLLSTPTLPVGSGQGSKGVIYGEPARYNDNKITLQDGDECALQVDINGKVIIAS